MSAQILVVASNLSEDLYKKIFPNQASAQKLLWISRACVGLVIIASFLIAVLKISSIYQLVLYSWSGLGASFGPLLLLSLYQRSINRYGGFCGILVGGLTAAIWPWIETHYLAGIPSLVAGFVFSALTIEIVSRMARNKEPIPTE